MRVIIFFLCIILEINRSFSASTCSIAGLKEGSRYNSYEVQIPIADTHDGVIASFQTKNILQMKIHNVNYLNATWQNQVLTLFVTDAFNNYEKESEYSGDPKITVSLDCICTKDTSQKMTIEQPVVDINNHNPITNKKRYDYTFGMTVPEELRLTDLLPLKVDDIDVSNSEVTFEIKENQHFKLGTTKVTSNTKSYTTTLVVAKNLTAPLHEEFILTITDNGHPIRHVTVPVTLTVMTPEELEKMYQKVAEVGEHQEDSISVHPPVFSEHLYFADYNSHHEFKMEEPVIISYGAQSNTKLKQLGYEEYFNADFKELFNYKTIIVKNTKPLPKHILETTDMISIEIEARNEGLHMAGRTAVLIRLPNLGKIGSNEVSEENSEDCDVVIKYGYFADTYTVPFILFLLAVSAIVFTNVYIIIMFVNKNKIRGNI